MDGSDMEILLRQKNPILRSGCALTFGPFRLAPRGRLLLKGKSPVRIGSRALDILIALVERPGELITKEELMRRVWPTTHVVDGNLRFQIAALRRALGDGQDGCRYLDTTPGRGYRFVAAVSVRGDVAAHEATPTAPQSRHNLPGRLTPLIGRESVIARLTAQLSRQRLLTVVGPAGIGKSSVVIAVAETLIDKYQDGVWLVDLATIHDPTFVRSASASVLGLDLAAGDCLSTMLAAIKDRNLLLVLDNCAHVIDAAASLATAVMKGAPGVQVLASSREPLCVDGEGVHRLAKLDCPPFADEVTAPQALEYSAVRLFVERATAATDEFILSDADVPCVSEICHGLDGIPLAIELAAARVDILGVTGIADRLDDRLELLTGLRRGATPRHRTIAAALDWGYELLSQKEQAIFRRLAIFKGRFTSDEAIDAIAGTRHAAAEVREILERLVAKSFIAAQRENREVSYRLLEITRAYALSKAAASEKVDFLGLGVAA